MELVMVIAIGLIVLFNVLAFAKLHSRVDQLLRAISIVAKDLEWTVYDARNNVVETTATQHKKTRKETQEIKTRLTQARKDLNVIEKQTKRGGDKS